MLDRVDSRGNRGTNARRAMRVRRDAMIEGLRHFPEGSRCVPPAGGFFCWVTLPEGVSADDLFSEAAAEGIAYVKGSDCLLEGGERTLRRGITVAYLVAAEAGKHLALTGIQPAISRMHGLFRRSGVMRH
mgnify:CR=1 FL=1